MNPLERTQTGYAKYDSRFSERRIPSCWDQKREISASESSPSGVSDLVARQNSRVKRLQLH